MPAPKSSPSSSESAGAKRKPATKPSAGAAAKGATAKPKTAAAAKPKRAATKSTPAATPAKSTAKAPSRSLTNPLDLVILTRDRIQETLDEATQRGRMTRSDANELVAELVSRGRQQTDDVLAEFERRLNRGREQLESATRKARRAEPVDRLVRTADRARRTARVGPAFPILGYDDLTAAQVTDRLTDLKPAELRKVRDYERRHANRKSVLDAIEKALA
jgi:polyhydroxyalkanoate synthesis regulator phasin